jgi:hypothetical protein
MDPNAFAALISALAGTPLAPIAMYAPILIAVCAVLAAVLPVPAAGSPWVPARKLLDLVAFNIGSARNVPKADPAAPAKAA